MQIRNDKKTNDEIGEGEGEGDAMILLRSKT